MSTKIANLEHNRILELAREYKGRGYEVSVEPGRQDLPGFLQKLNYQPDLLARSTTGNVVIEVKSRKTIRDAKNLAAVSKVIDLHESWEFLLVYTNPRKSNAIEFDHPNLSKDAINRAIEAALVRPGVEDSNESRIASLLLLWSSFEAAITLSLPSSNRPRTSLGLIRDSVMSGLISRESHRFLERVMKKRNEVAHGRLTLEISLKELNKLTSVCREVLAENDV